MLQRLLLLVGAAIILALWGCGQAGSETRLASSGAECSTLSDCPEGENCDATDVYFNSLVGTRFGTCRKKCTISSHECAPGESCRAAWDYEGAGVLLCRVPIEPEPSPQPTPPAYSCNADSDCPSHYVCRIHGTEGQRCRQVCDTGTPFCTVLGENCISDPTPSTIAGAGYCV